MVTGRVSPRPAPTWKTVAKVPSSSFCPFQVVCAAIRSS